MSHFTLVGLLASAVLFFALGFLLLKGKPAIRRMYFVMILIGLGYLAATGAMEDIGRGLLGEPQVAAPQDIAVPDATTAPAAETAAPTPAPAPAPEAAPAPAPAAPANDNAPAANPPAAATP